MSIRQPQKLPTILSVALMSAFSSVFHFPWSKRKPIQVLSGSRRVTVPELQGAPCARVGNIGGIASHEYHVATAIGEDTLLVCNSCNYAANQEKATGLLPHVPLHPVPVSDAMSQQLLHRVEVLPLRSKSLKVAFASTKDLLVACVLRSDCQLSELKLQGLFQEPVTVYSGLEIDEHSFSHCRRLSVFLDNGLLEESTAGSTLLLPTVAPTGDEQAASMLANCTSAVVQELRTTKAHDLCTQCAQWTPAAPGTLSIQAGIEVGHTFLLGNKYSKALKANIVRADGASHIMEMGCYGIGVSRIIAAVVETSHDKQGIIWPTSIAPYRVCIVALNGQQGKARGTDGDSLIHRSEALYDFLSNESILRGNVLLDTSERSVGVKLNDAHLLGYPWIVVVGAKTPQDQIEVIQRRTGQKFVLTPAQLVEKIAVDLAELD
eukprot:m.214627 g.214627  ORF g.214627 m.214627 type:complete len:434 (-) comp54063_c0_seq2:99-1400(-)